MKSELHCVILAAGQGTRMKSRRPKVLQLLAGRPLLQHVLTTAQALQPAGLHVVYGHGGATLPEAFAAQADIQWVEQPQQLGTGHAVAQALPGIPDGATVLVLYGDVPLTPPDTLRALVAAARSQLTLLTVELDRPDGYGRILRDDTGQLRAIIEHKDASAAQRKIREVNTGLMAGSATALRGYVDGLSRDNAQGEYYLTDCVALAVAAGQAVQSVAAACEADVLGVNDRAQLAAVERIYQRRQAAVLMTQGLQLLDPERFDVRGELRVGADCQIDVNCVFEGRVELADDVRIGPNCQLRDVRVGAGTRIAANSVLEQCDIGAACAIGPFARIRPGSLLADAARAGNFVEIKNARIGPGSKINHLSYIGDATLGAGVNIGAGTITCNYDGANKHRTEIGDDAFIGSNSSLIAPVVIGSGATVGAGSTISKPAPAGELTVARGKQVTLRGWQRPRKQKD